MSDDYGEPWRGEDGRIYDRDDGPVAFRVGGIADPGHLRRAVAAVNALAGLSTEDIEGGAVERLADAAREAQRWRYEGVILPTAVEKALARLAAALAPFAPPAEGRPGV